MCAFTVQLEFCNKFVTWCLMSNLDTVCSNAFPYRLCVCILVLYVYTFYLFIFLPLSCHSGTGIGVGLVCSLLLKSELNSLLCAQHHAMLSHVVQDGCGLLPWEQALEWDMRCQIVSTTSVESTAPTSNPGLVTSIFSIPLSLLFDCTQICRSKPTLN